MTYEVEDIPDESTLFRRVPDNRLDKAGRARPGAFTDHGSGMSVGWDKYTTATQEQAGAREPKRFAVVSLPTQAVRALTLRVTHSPRDWNRAHADVIGEKDEEVRLNLARMAVVVIEKPR